ncbi:hypothetical protein DUI87_14601 [Hirundo rustica rustica]|uniref:Hemicentin-1 n=1 Tax=Hirundo rustica rustica TaxID=333673 RepID=A0A3M0K585_HIRRU|nr:hypothetical protein DUI87_14601 [Hirundo rustica rustica]
MSQEPWPDRDGIAPLSSILGLGVMENHILEETSHHDQKDEDGEFLTTPLQADEHVLIQGSGHTLHIKEAQVSDMGRYTCLASNIAGEDELEFDVNIQVPPSFQKPYREWEAGNMLDAERGGESKDVIVNNPLSLYCETNAVPPPVLTWFKDGHPLSSSDRVLILPAPPSISGADGDQPEEVTVLVGKEAAMDCIPSGSPSPRVTWQKDGQLLAEDDKHTFLSDGRRLQILNSQITDTGRYVCIAENLAGSAKKYFNLNVHVPPSVVGTNPENLTVVVNNFISLTCEVTGFPPPDLSWLKNGKPISSNSNTFIVPELSLGSLPSAPSIKAQGGTSVTVLNVRVGTPVTLDCESNAIPAPVITWSKNGRAIPDSAAAEVLADGQTLWIKAAEVSDTGQYVCKAINIAGRDDKNFHLNVYVPPSIEGPEQELVSESISNPVTFVCDATGIPPPTLVWLKNGKPIEYLDSLEVHILSGGSKLQIARSQLLDSGTYTCIASNPEGKAQKTYVLSIQVPPTIANSKDEAEELTALLDTSLNIECAAAGTPPPQLHWLKNGLPLSVSSQIKLLSAGRILRLARVQISDTGVYTCVASNRAGVHNKHYNLRVLVPPSLDNAGGTEEVLVLRGGAAALGCVSDGSPVPSVSWLKDGRALPLSLGAGLSSSRRGMVLQVLRAEPADTGRYTCVASNAAGQSSKHFVLKVLEPPHINGSDEPEELSVIVNNPLQLLCISSGIPVPKISWMKDGRPLLQTDNIHMLGETLRITSAQVEDTGRYTCLASSPAGDADKEYLVRVHVPPNIAGTGGPQELTVLQNSQVILECRSDAVPPPIISWLKDGEQLEGDPLLLLDPLSNARSLWGIKAAESSVRGLSVPSLLAFIAVQWKDVLCSGEASSEALTPACVCVCPQGGPRLRILSSGRYLQINNAELGDSATYTCVARNVAGETTREFLLAVHVAPTIRSSPQTTMVHINTSVLLECAAEGVPAPRITWRKDGAVFTGNNSRYSVLEDGSLHIPWAQVADTGRYMCMATNAAGSERQRIDLHVLVPPTIAPGQTNITVTVNEQTTLPCEATGIPRPAISWKKNGHLLSVDQNQNTYRLLSSGSLVIISPTVDDTAVYECSVSNAAGEDQRAIDLTVQVPPSIADEATELLVTKLSPVVISCTASGVPIPSVHWTKNGIKLLPRGDGYRIVSSGAVEIPSAQLAHGGRYTCMARNAAGSAHRHVTLHVQEPPIIQAQPGALDVIVNNPIVLPCEATGTPQPVITWQKEGINIITTGNSYTVQPSGSLQIARAAVEDAGTYMCVAQNPAGTALGKIKLKVQVPPVIKSHVEEYVVAIDQSVTLQCEAEGYPVPEISWHKVGQQITDSMRRRILSTGALQLLFVQPGDSGRYTCTAANPAGSSSSGTELIVHVPPRIRSTDTQYTVTESSQAVLSCVAEGIPTPAINWRKDNMLLRDTVGKYQTVPGGDLILDNVVPEDSGSYTCIATNTAGEDTHTVTLTVHVLPAFTELPGDVALTKGEQLRLSCKATGVPVPRITWTFNNNIIPAQYDDVNGHSELLIERVSKEDSGTYVCSAENTVGSIKAIGFVYVKEPPVFKGDYHSSRIEPLGGNAMLNCEVRGDPPPTIQWSKKGVGVQISNRIRQLVNGSLAIYGTVNEDAGDYKCVASNDAGVVERSLTLTLQSPPVITVEPVGMVLEAGATAVLDCQAMGEPLPTIGWSRQGQPVLDDDRVTLLPNGSLRIAPLQREDTSEYECVARNLLGSVLVTVPLTVQVHGGFSSWLEWRACSVTCGQGVQERVRQCDSPVPANGGRGCQGPHTDLRSCHRQPCPGGPARAKGSIIGNINDVEFGIAFLNATVTDSPDSDTRVIQAKITNVPRTLGPAMRKLISILSPVYWTTAKEIGEAMNGFTLTDAVFKRETQVEFATGEILRMTHVARGLDVDGALLLDVVVSGHVLQLQSVADVSVKDYTEDYIQTGPGQLHAHSTRLFTADGVSVPYTWNHTITYASTKGRMPFLVQTLRAASITAEYNPLQEAVAFQIQASIAKDEDECAVGNPCSHTCHNAVGSYYCSCPKGLTISADGRTCQDIDECVLGGHSCHAGQDCENLPGSFRCVLRCGSGFRRTPDGFSCQDVNECRQNVCRPDQLCRNTRGGYKCIDLCPSGMTKAENGTCIDVDECRSGSHQCRYNQLCENTRGSYRCVCPRGFRAQGTARPCVDIDECESGDTCQHECRNSMGSFQCVCPAGYRLMPNGKTCQDIDECLEENINCGSNQMCFNMRGSYQCIDTPCPPNYQREPHSGFCLKSCPANDLECDLSTYALEYKLLSLPSGIAAGQDLIRLVAYTHDQVVHPRTTFLMADEDPSVPFALRDENWKGVVFTTQALREPRTYRMGVRALSYSADGSVEYRTTFIVYIAVSAFPY